MNNDKKVQGPPRVLATVGFITWVPSDSGRINTTDKHAQMVRVWVNHPFDDRYPAEARGGEQAISIAKETLAKNGVEWLGLVGVEVNTEIVESVIINQPKDRVASVEGDTGIRLVER